VNKLLIGLTAAGLCFGGGAFACDMHQHDASADAPMMSKGTPASTAVAAAPKNTAKPAKVASKPSAKPDSVAVQLKTVAAQ
jgi:hypothetical protein